MKSNDPSINTLYVQRSIESTWQLRELRSSNCLPSWSAARTRAFFGLDSWKQMKDNDYEDDWWWKFSSTRHDHGESCNCHWSSKLGQLELVRFSPPNASNRNHPRPAHEESTEKLHKGSKILEKLVKKWMSKVEKSERNLWIFGWDLKKWLLVFQFC